MRTCRTAGLSPAGDRRREEEEEAREDAAGQRCCVCLRRTSSSEGKEGSGEKAAKLAQSQLSSPGARLAPEQSLPSSVNREEEACEIVLPALPSLAMPGLAMALSSPTKG